jgi:hypothetical protein
MQKPGRGVPDATRFTASRHSKLEIVMANDSSALGAIEIATQDLGRAGWHAGRVLAREGQWLSVRIGTRCVDAMRADGCILMPEADDEVAVLETADACYVTQVLLRRGDAPRVWDAGRAVSLNAEEISLTASRMNAVVEDMRPSPNACRFRPSAATVTSAKPNRCVSACSI